VARGDGVQAACRIGCVAALTLEQQGRGEEYQNIFEGWNGMEIE
jgi:hypothetical protein